MKRLRTLFRLTLTKRLSAPVLGALLFLTTLTLFWKTGSYDFVNFDDPLCVPLNIHVLRGLNPDSVEWAFSGKTFGFPHPLTWISWMIDVELFGPEPGAMHLVNVLLHALNALLLFALLYYGSGSMWLSLSAAMIFAFHPQRAESVAWVTERKDVLWVTFGLICLYGYIRYRKTNRFSWYVLSLVSFILSVLAKPMAVLLAPALVLVEFWPLQNIRSLRLDRSIAAIVPTLVPFGILALVSSAFTLLQLQNDDSLGSLETIPWDLRVATAGEGFLGYVRNFIYPVGLCALYPFEYETISMLSVLGWVFAACCTLLSIASLRVGNPYIFVGWFWFFITLLPVSGLLQAGPQSMADRYSYFASIGLSIILVWGGAALLQRRSGVMRNVSLALFSVWLALLPIKTFYDLEHWRDSKALWDRVLSITADKNFCYTAHGNMASVLAQQGDWDGAAFHAKAAWIQGGIDMVTTSILAQAYLEKNDHSRAERVGRLLLEKGGNKSMGYLILADSSRRRGERKEAALWALKAMLFNPSTQAAAIVAEFYREAGNGAKAVRYSTHAYNLSPWSLAALRTLWRDIREIRATFEETLRYYLELAPAIDRDANPLKAAGLEEYVSSNYANAIALFAAALRIQPDLPTLLTLAACQFDAGDIDGCVRSLTEAKLNEVERFRWVVDQCWSKRDRAPLWKNALLALGLFPESFIDQSSTALFIRGLALARSGDYEKSLNQLIKAESLADERGQEGLKDLIQQLRSQIPISQNP